MSKPSRRRIATVLAEQTLKHGVSKKFSREVAAYLLETGRSRELDPIMRDIQAVLAERGYIEANAVCTHPLGSKLMAEVTSRVRKLYPAAKRIIINQVEDPEVIGNVRIELPNQQLDFTIRTKLNKFKQLTVGKD